MQPLSIAEINRVIKVLEESIEALEHAKYLTGSSGFPMYVQHQVNMRRDMIEHLLELKKQQEDIK